MYTKFSVIKEVNSPNQFSCGTLSCDAQRVILGTQDGLLKIWNYKQKKNKWVEVAGHLAMVSSLTYYAYVKITSIAVMKAEDEHDFIVTSSKDCTVQVTKKNTHLAVLAMHNSPVLLQKMHL